MHPIAPLFVMYQPIRRMASMGRMERLFILPGSRYVVVMLPVLLGLTLACHPIIPPPPLATPEQVVGDDTPMGKQRLQEVRGWYLRALAALAQDDQEEFDRALGWMARRAPHLAATWQRIAELQLAAGRPCEAQRSVRQGRTIDADAPALTALSQQLQANPCPDE